MHSRTYVAIPPGARIKEQLEYRKQSQKELAARMGISEKHMSHLINGDVALTPDMAVKLEIVLGVPASFWNGLEATYREKIAKIKFENAMDTDEEIVKELPYDQLAAAGWVPETEILQERVLNLRKFFEVVELKVLNGINVTRVACHSLSVVDKNDFKVLAWIQNSKIIARSINTEVLNTSQLDKCADELSSLRKENAENVYEKCAEILARYGIAFVCTEPLGSLDIRGASFMDGTRTVISIVLGNKVDDNFWFSLFHELGHVSLEHLNKVNGTDADDEMAADEWARSVLSSGERIV